MATERQRPLDGMPLALGDVFVCGPADIAPWETELDELARRRRRGAPAGPEPERDVWLVLRACADCRPRSYCWAHWPRTDAERAAERARKGERPARWA